MRLPTEHATSASLPRRAFLHALGAQLVTAMLGFLASGSFLMVRSITWYIGGELYPEIVLPPTLDLVRGGFEQSNQKPG
jgi:hypothetical protein